jgi:hypothetical protein
MYLNICEIERVVVKKTPSRLVLFNNLSLIFACRVGSAKDKC